MYDRDASEKRGLHDPTGAAQFEVFRHSDQPDLKLGEGWYWDDPHCRADTPTYPRAPDGTYLYAYGPFPTSTAAYDHAMTDLTGDLAN